MSREIHIAVNGSNQGKGTKEQPYKTISFGAEVAQPGDRVIVHGGEYREWVKPKRGGTSNINRITYEAAEGEKVVIKGSEIIDHWELVEGTVWKATVDNEIFGDYNPYSTEIFGDWSMDPLDWHVHAGDVYLNGKSFYEAKSLMDVKNPVKRTEGYHAPWTKKMEPLLHPEDSIYQWYAEVLEDVTVIYANFHEANPNKELVEINVRKCCFYPDKTGRNYITVRGFEMAQAASPWTPPTADQPGLLGVNWSKGWIIEDNMIHDAKCSGISIGKEELTGDMLCTKYHRKPGYQHQMESVFMALQAGWSRDKIGSHIIRNNEIYDCGQNGIVGHLGCVFSEIYHNHIYNIAVKHEFFGYEIAGIKLHAPIDVQIHHNNLHHCTLGVWLDWQVQGTRISKNLFYANDRDLMIEVTHGPHLVDHNILASDYNFDNIAQGGAYVHNLCCGTMRREPVLNRATPYHFPHSTGVAGVTFVYGGDDRWYQNIFLGGTKTYTEQSTNGTVDYNGSPTSLEEYVERILATGNGDNEIFEQVKDPVYINQNGYLKGAPCFHREEERFVSEKDPKVKIVREDGKTYLEINIEKGLIEMKTKVLDTTDLGMTRIVEAPFEDPNGNLIVFDTDYNDVPRDINGSVGPFAQLKEGFNRIKIWG
ncbi:MAG TPA: right-handed parallel beta-helix repeat-containing protein [Candidatus Merdenecus merdavium]|nr:right-handed parallel beta-helix repeat-containing protein [Candidatus Merdenecus merdavium]